MSAKKKGKTKKQQKTSGKGASRPSAFKPKPKKAPTVVTGARSANTTGERRATPADHPHLPGRGIKGNPPTSLGIPTAEPETMETSVDMALIGSEPVPGVPQYVEVEALTKCDFPGLVYRHASLSKRIKALEEEKKDISFELEMLMEAAEVKEVAVGGTKVNFVAPSSSMRLDRIKLAKAGVTPEQLEAGQVEVPRKGHVRVLPPGSKDRNGGGEE